jgi:hypothetical protein
MIVYLDLDRTLFRTKDFFSVWDGIAREYPQAIGAGDRRQEYYRTVDDMYFYDMNAQLSDLGLDPDAVYSDMAASEYADGRLEQEGAAALIAALEDRGVDVRILTFGDEACQRFKVSLCPSLRHLNVLTTERSKADVLHDSEEECWLVDDKPIGDELPGNVSFVQVSLEGGTVSPDTTWPVFYDLYAVRDFFADVLD